MVITKLDGGIGNQMFQYACARALAIRNGRRVWLDLDSIERDGNFRNYKLNELNITADKSNNLLSEFFRSSAFQYRVVRRIATALRSEMKYIKEFNPPSFNENLLTSKIVNCYLDGYWQSEKYFKDIEDIIRIDFKFINQPSQSIKTLANKIESTNSVAIHVRRGDYMSNPTTHMFHGVCPASYYRAGIELICKQISQPIFYIFTDDPSWVKANLTFSENSLLVSEQTSNEVQDLFLMTRCKHFIIANSSFSWWGAWLGNNEFKKVIAPKVWFKDEDANMKFNLPPTWARI